MPPPPNLVGPIVYDVRLGIHTSKPVPPAEISGEQYPERYIFLLLGMLLFIRFVNVLRQYRQEYRARDLVSTAEYERLEAAINGLEDEPTTPISRVSVSTTRILLPSEIAQLSQRPTDDPYYVVTLFQTPPNPISQLPEYEELVQITKTAQCDGQKSTPTDLPQHLVSYLGDLPPTYLDATTSTPPCSPDNLNT